MPRTYTMTAGAILAKARVILNDARTDIGGYRDDDPVLLAHLNDALGAMVGVAPGLFAKTLTHTCTAGATQELANDRAVAFLDILGLTEADLPTLNLFAPGWTSAAGAAAREFLRLPGEPLRFMVYPPALAGQALSVRAVQAHAPLTSAGSQIELPENYEPMLVEYVAGRAEMKDDEHVNSNRAAQLLERFAAGVKALAA